jgi:chromosome segregation ATPase
MYWQDRGARRRYRGRRYKRLAEQTARAETDAREEAAAAQPRVPRPKPEPYVMSSACSREMREIIGEYEMRFQNHRETLFIEAWRRNAEERRETAAHDQEIAECQRKIAERDQVISEQASEIIARDQAIVKRDQVIALRNQKLAECHRVIVRRDQEIAECRRKIAEQASEINRLAGILGQQENIEREQRQTAAS